MSNDELDKLIKQIELEIESGNPYAGVVVFFTPEESKLYEKHTRDVALRSIIVHGVPVDVSDDDIEALVTTFGNVEASTIKVCGMTKDVIAQYESAAAAVSAMESMNSFNFHGKILTAEPSDLVLTFPAALNETVRLYKESRSLSRQNYQKMALKATIKSISDRIILERKESHNKSRRA